MAVLVNFLGVVIVVFGIYYLLKPKMMKSYLAFWKTGKRLYAAAGLSLLIGIIFLTAASQCTVSWCVALFGILALMKGIALSVLKLEKAISMLNWWAQRPVAFLRIHALFAIAIGALLIYCA